jgi:hypothetical protein
MTTCAHGIEMTGDGSLEGCPTCGEGRHHLTLQDLRDLLQVLLDRGVAPSTLVYTEGCDCTGYAHGVIHYGDGVEIVR